VARHAVCNHLGVAAAVLVVENNAFDSRASGARAHREGFAPITAPNGAGSAAPSESGVPAKVILLDLLDAPDGRLGVPARTAARIPRLADIPVIVTSAADKAMSPDLFFDTVFANRTSIRIIARVRQLCTSRRHLIA